VYNFTTKFPAVAEKTANNLGDSFAASGRYIGAADSKCWSDDAVAQVDKDETDQSSRSRLPCDHFCSPWFRLAQPITGGSSSWRWATSIPFRFPLLRPLFLFPFPPLSPCRVLRNAISSPSEVRAWAQAARVFLTIATPENASGNNRSSNLIHARRFVSTETAVTKVVNDLLLAVDGW